MSRFGRANPLHFSPEFSDTESWISDEDIKRLFFFVEGDNSTDAEKLAKLSKPKFLKDKKDKD